MERDYFSQEFNQLEIREGDIFSFRDAGAYTMAFNSNFIIKPADVIYIRI